jgi:hypothetical protein
MPADARRRERGTYRHDFLNQVHSASESPAMREIGLEPYGPSYR